MCVSDIERVLKHVCVCVSVPGLIAGVVCSSWGVVGVAVSGRVVVSAHRKKQTDIRNETIRRTREVNRTLES